jgi:hypothetical protein
VRGGKKTSSGRGKLQHETGYQSQFHGVTRNELTTKAMNFAITRNELTARGCVMEQEMSVQRKLRAVTQGELTTKTPHQSECAAKASNELCAAKTKRREGGSPTDAAA